MDKTIEEMMQDPEFLLSMAQQQIDPAQLSPEEITAVYADYEGQRGLLDRQRSQSEALRDASQAGLGGTQAGGVFVADNPFEAIAGVAGEYANHKKQKGFDEQEAGLADKNALARQAMGREYAKAIRGGQGPGGMEAQYSPGQMRDEEERRKLMQFQMQSMG